MFNNINPLLSYISHLFFILIILKPCCTFRFLLCYLYIFREISSHRVMYFI